MKSWRGIAGAAAGAAAASVAAGVAAERYAVSRLLGRLDTEVVRRFHAPRGRRHTVTADDGVPLHVEVDGDGIDGSTGSTATMGSMPSTSSSFSTSTVNNADSAASVDSPDSTGLTLVFCHGWTLERASWHFQRQGLADLGRLVFWDQRCHGRSGRAQRDGISIAALGADLRAVLDATAPRGPLVLVGHSLGGMTIMALAAAYPQLFAHRVSGVALLNTSAGGFAEALPGARGVALRRVAPACLDAMSRVAGSVERVRGISGMLSHLATQRLAFGTGDVGPELVAFMDGMVRATPVDVVADYYPAILAHDERGSLDSLRGIPALVLAGARDRVIPVTSSRAIAAALPDAEHLEIPAAGHMVMLEHPGIVNDALCALVGRARRFAEVGHT